jgi:hypothetical protein
MLWMFAAFSFTAFAYRRRKPGEVRQVRRVLGGKRTERVADNQDLSRVPCAYDQGLVSLVKHLDTMPHTKLSCLRARYRSLESGGIPYGINVIISLTL